MSYFHKRNMPALWMLWFIITGIGSFFHPIFFSLFISAVIGLIFITCFDFLYGDWRD